MPTGNPYPWYLTSESIDEEHSRIVAWVEEFRAKHEYGPTSDEIAKGTGGKVQTVRTMVERLLRSGYLTRKTGSSFVRTLRKATAEEKQKVLLQGWVEKLEGLPEEERRAALMAATKLLQDAKSADARAG